MARGTVKFFNASKGFGFIQPDGGGADLFVHISAIEKSGLRTLIEGQRVQFEIVRDNRTGKYFAGSVASGTHGSGGGPKD